MQVQAIPAAPKRAFSIPEVVEAASICRTTVFAEIAAGRLVARKLGRRTVVLASDLETWLEQLPSIDPNTRVSGKLAAAA
jgi:hypothetical protein